MPDSDVDEMAADLDLAMDAAAPQQGRQLLLLPSPWHYLLCRNWL